MKNQNLLDQFLLNDELVVKGLVVAADIKKTDRVLEIGAGRGVVTKEIAQKAGKVLAIEIDTRFKKDLSGLPPNVKIIWGDALKKINKLKFNKIVGSLPSSLVEPLMQKLTKIDFVVASFLVPLKFVNKLYQKSDFNKYFATQLVEKVSRNCFVPRPKTNWALIKIFRKYSTKNPPLF